MEKYIRLAKEVNMVNAMIISSKDICFDIRAILKCYAGQECPAYRILKPLHSSLLKGRGNSAAFS